MTTCETCGSPVKIYSSREGTSSYEPIANAELTQMAEMVPELVEKICTMTLKLKRAEEALADISIAKDCEDFGPVLGGKLMDRARQALKELRGEG